MFLGHYALHEVQNRYRIINPFTPKKVQKHPDTGRDILSYGCGHSGYDLTLSSIFVFNKQHELLLPGYKHNNTKYPMIANVNCTSEIIQYNYVLDPLSGLYDKDNEHWVCVDTQGQHIVLGPGANVLTNTSEYLSIPEGHIGICVGKSTYARCGILVNTTPLEPRWQGYLVIEITNLNSVPVLMRVGEGIAQLLIGKCTVTTEYSGRWQQQKSLRDVFGDNVRLLTQESKPVEQIHSQQTSQPSDNQANTTHIPSTKATKTRNVKNQ